MGVGIDDINNCSQARFIELLGAVFEHSPWVPEQVYAQRPFGSREDLHQAMVDAVGRATEKKRRALLCSHPELAGTEAASGMLTDASRREQAGAGLDQCSADELRRLQMLNRAYRERFGFPFIIAVAGLDRHQIIAALERRLGNDAAQEFDTALGEVDRIARIRIDKLIDG